MPPSYRERAAKLRAMAKQLSALADQLDGMAPKRSAPASSDDLLVQGNQAWTREAGDLWRAAVGDVRYGRLGKALTALVAIHGWALVKPALESYLKSRPHMRSNGTIWGDLPTDGPHNMVDDRRFMCPEDFAKTFQTWRARCQ